MTPKFQDRIDKLQNLMREQNIDLLFINNRENLLYLTGIIEVECMAILLPKDDDPVAITLSQDTEYIQENSGIRTIGYHFPLESLGSKVTEELSKQETKFSTIGFERYFVDFEVYDYLRKIFNEKGFVNASNLFYKVRSVKDTEEINYIKEASRIVSIGMDAAMHAVKIGSSEIDVLAQAEYAMLKAGSYGSSFRPQIASGQRSFITHPMATDKKIQSDETVIINLSATYKGYCSKITRTAYVGSVNEKSKSIYEMLISMHTLLIEKIKPGMLSDEVYSMAEGVLAEFNYQGSFLNIIGYGIGLRQSEFYPIIGKSRKDLIENNMVITLLLPTLHSSTNQGFKVTDVIWIKEGGNEVLTKFPYNTLIVN